MQQSPGYNYLIIKIESTKQPLFGFQADSNSSNISSSASTPLFSQSLSSMTQQSSSFGSQNIQNQKTHNLFNLQQTAPSPSQQIHMQTQNLFGAFQTKENLFGAHQHTTTQTQSLFGSSVTPSQNFMGTQHSLSQPTQSLFGPITNHPGFNLNSQAGLNISGSSGGLFKMEK